MRSRSPARSASRLDRLKSLLLIVPLLLAASACGTPQPGARERSASLIVHNARIYTVDPSRPEAQAIAVAGDRIVRVGTDDEVLKLRAEATHIIDAAGAAIVPGLHDAHGHFTSLGATLRLVDLRGTTSYQEVIDRVRRRAAVTPRGEWILGRGWDQNDWPVASWPVHDLLSAATPDHPVYLTRIDGHAALVNRRALDRAGVTAATPDPPGGRILRDASGRPTGVLIDRAAELVSSRIPSARAADIEAQAMAADVETRRLGLTMVHDAGTDGATVDVYRRLIGARQLKTRLYVMLRGRLADLLPHFDRGPVHEYGGHRLAVRAIKIQIDGALGSRGAALIEPYSDEPGTRGLLTTPLDEVYAQAAAAARAGFQTAIHAIGDRANRLALDVFERVAREIPGARQLRPRVEHAQILDAADIPRFAALGVIASMQPVHATSDMPWVPARIGELRMREGAYMWRTLRNAGARIAAGSDFPVEEANPLLGFHAAITRQDPSGRPPGGWMPEERLTRDEALCAFTIDAAYAAHADDRLGSLEPGKLADFVMLSRDIMQIPPREILGVRVLLTVVGGEIVYDGREERTRFAGAGLQTRPFRRYQRGSRRRPANPPRELPRLLPPPKLRRSCGLASLTVSRRPSNSRWSSASHAWRACASSGISTNANPRDRPVAWSRTRWADSTVP